MPTQLQTSLTLTSYLAFDDASEERHEYEAGQVYVRSHGNTRHNRICGNIARHLADRLNDVPAQVFIIDVKLHVQAADSVYYPDVFVYCGSSIANEDKLVNDATLVVEVLSDSTAARDRRQKRLAYQKLPGLRAYWIVSQTEQRVEVYSRQTGDPVNAQWQAQAYGLEDVLFMDLLGAEPILVSTLYSGTDIAA